MTKPKIQAVVGSLRTHSYNRQLALAAQNVCKGRAELELLDYSDIPYMNQDIEYPAPPLVAAVRTCIEQADGVWFFSPEYNHFFPGVLKNLLDWLSRPPEPGAASVLNGKPAALSGISPGMGGTATGMDHLVTLISLLNMAVMNKPRLRIPQAQTQLDEEGRLRLTTSASMLEEQAEAFIQFIARCKPISV